MRGGLFEATSDRATGADKFVLAVQLAFSGWIGCVLLQLALYLRPAPHGGPFLAEWERYFWLALYYDLMGVWLLSLPFFLLWLILYRRKPGQGWTRTVALGQIVLLTGNLLFSELDHEIIRFLGVRLNPTFVFAYSNPHALSDGLFLDVLRGDRGGPFAPLLLLLLLVPGGYAGWAVFLMRRKRGRAPARWLAIVLAMVPLAAPLNAWQMATSQFRLRKVEPVLFAFATDLAAGYDDLQKPADYNSLVADYQRRWLARSADQGWHFPSLSRPYLRVPVGHGLADVTPEQWNVLYIQLETFRGVDMGFLRPALDPMPTPWLDGFARRPDAAVWTRTSSFGMPSINGIFATHCSIAPPSRRYVTALTHVDFLCLPEVLRAHGYRAEMFHGDDTDWDNSSYWFTKWYDKLWRFPEAERQDRRMFRRAVERIKVLGRADRPFFAAVVSVTNQTPFNNPEPSLDMNPGETAAERIVNTTHYTDDVVGEFIEALEDEPWFGRTLIVITGDHGFSVGEHGSIPGQQNLYRESVWVPLIIAGQHPRLQAGWHEQPVSLLDLSPTLADLLGIRVANPWQGHSLLAIRETGSLGFTFRDATLWQSAEWSALRDPRDGEARLYSTRRDWLQRRDLTAAFPGRSETLLGRAAARQRLHDFLLRHGRLK